MTQTFVLQDRLTGMESKLAVVMEFQMEFQRNQSWLLPALARHVVQAAQLPNQAPAVPAAAAVEQPTYNAGPTYDALLYRKQFGQPVGASLPAQPSGFAAYSNYLFSSGNMEQHLPQESNGYDGEQCFYNDEEYPDDGLSYEIPPNYSPLTSQELFLSGGDAACVGSTAPILPGFFSNSVKQCLSASNAEPVTVTQSGALNLVKVSPMAKSDTSVALSVVSTPTSASVSTVASLPLTTQTVSQPSPLAAPKFVLSPSTVTVTTTMSTASDAEPAPSNGSKTVFGGFSFTTAPPVVPYKSTDEKKAADKAVSKAENPFANFSFSSPAASKAGDKTGAENVVSKPTFGGFSAISASALASSIVVGVRSTGSELPVFGSGVKAGDTTFADLAKQEAKGSSAKVDSSNVFRSAGEELFQHRSAKSPGSAGRANISGHEDEEYVPDQEFQPLVSLPEVEVKTGEEDEEKLFGERAKLYRMDAESKQWKERGIGEIKILCHRISGRFRIVMRREQVLKLCANHYITASMKLVPMKTSETSLCWFASDFSEGEVQKEQLCIKFKTADIAQKFCSCFEDCQLKCGQQKTDQAQLSTSSKPAESTDVTQPLSDLFKPKSGQWVCSGCYITNESSNVSCIACMAAKPGTVAVSVDLPAVASSTGAPLSAVFQAKAGEWDCASCYVRNGADRTACAACETPKPGATVTVDSSASTKSDCTFKIAPTGGFVFSTAAGKPFVFGGTASPFTSTSAVTSSSNNQSTSAATPEATSLSGFVMPSGFKPASTAGSSSFVTPSSFTFGTQPEKNGTSAKAGADVFQSLGKPAATSRVTGASTMFQSSSSTPSFALLSSTPVSDKAASSTTKENKSLFGTPSFVFEGVKPVSSLSSLAVAESSFKFTGLCPATPAQPPAPLSPRSPQSPDNELYVTGADDEPNVSFEPVVRLPDNVELKTGEEDEDTLYCQRAKLYRFVDSEWKERGIGDVKLLRHQSTGVIRIVMRRERVLKLCLNHRVNASLTLQPMPNAQSKAWTWHADDFSDGAEPTHEKFSIRFKTEETAAEFKQAFDRVKNGKALPVVVSSRLDDAAVSQCPGPSILEELLTDGSSGYHGKTSDCNFDIIKLYDLGFWSSLKCNCLTVVHSV